MFTRGRTRKFSSRGQQTVLIAPALFWNLPREQTMSRGVLFLRWTKHATFGSYREGVATLRPAHTLDKANLYRAFELQGVRCPFGQNTGNRLALMVVTDFLLLPIFFTYALLVGGREPPPRNFSRVAVARDYRSLGIEGESNKISSADLFAAV